MDRTKALEVSNLIHDIENTDNFIDTLLTVEYDDSWDNATTVLRDILSNAISQARDYKKTLEETLEKL